MQDTAINLTEEFLSNLWPDGIPSGHLVVGRLDPREPKDRRKMRISWCESIDDVVKAVQTHRGDYDMYLGACTQDREAACKDNDKSRGKARTALALPGVFADVDVAGEGHKASNLAKTVEEAKAIIRSAGLEPSVWIESGHGVQAWWLFQEPWVLENETDRNGAASLLASWVATLQAHAETKFGGIKVDSVGDLARVMRMPGSINFKTDPRPVTASFTGMRYQLDDIEPLLYIRANINVTAPAQPIGDCPSDVAEIARHCVQVLAARRADSYEDWIKVGLTLKACGGDALRGLWHEFSRKSAKYDAGQTDAKWDGFEPERVSMGSLIAMAREDAPEVAYESDPENLGAGLDAAMGVETPRDVKPRDLTPSSAVIPTVAPKPATASSQSAATNQAGGRPRISNVVDNTYTDADGKEVSTTFYRPMPDIAQTMWDGNGGWPKLAGGLLFKVSGVGDVNRPDHRPVEWIGKPDQLFASLMADCDVRWHSGTVRHLISKDKLIAPTKTEFFEYLKAKSPDRFSAVELLPHHPPVPDVYYIPTALPDWTEQFVSPLHELLNELNPETEQDRWLMLAALLTPGWGGPCGTRPAFVMTSEHGRGVGKTSTVEMLSEIWGGCVTVGGSEDWDTVRKRLLGDESMTKRVLVIDNLKGKLNSADIEGAITMSTLDGWKPYHGQASRPNRLTWFITANSPSLSRDLADRSVIIKVGKQKPDKDFRSWAKQHIAKYRGEILAELFAILQREPLCKIEKCNRDRWQAWQDAVLSRLEGGNELAKLIISRRPDVDSDLSDADEIATAIEKLFSDRSLHDYDRRRIFITHGAMYQHLVKMGIIDKGFSRRAAATWIKDMAGQGPLACLRWHKMDIGRGWLYVGEMAAGIDHVDRIEELPFDH